MEKQKKVCILLGSSKLSGAEKRMIVTAHKLAGDKSLHVTLITRKALKEEFYKSELLSENSDLIWHTRRLSVFKNKYFRGTSNLIASTFYNFIQLPWYGGNVHIVLYNNTTLLSLLPVRLFGSSRFLFEVTSPDVAISSATKKLKRYSFLYDKLICVSNSVKKRLNVKNIKAIEIRKQPFAYFKEDKEIIVKENLVVYAHRLIPRKNPMLALEAFAILAEEFKDWEFSICGDGPLRDSVKDAVRMKELKNLTYNGYVYNMNALMRRSKVFVSLIEPDNYPSQSVFNAMTNNNALIISDTSDSAEKFIANNGYTVKLELDSIVNYLRKLLLQDNLNVMGGQSKKIFESRYCQKKYIDESKSFYY